MVGIVECCGITTKEVAQQQHFQRARFASRRGGDARHHPFLDDVETLGGFVFVEDELVLAVVEWGEIVEDPLGSFPLKILKRGM